MNLTETLIHKVLKAEFEGLISRLELICFIDSLEFARSKKIEPLPKVEIIPPTQRPRKDFWEAA